MYFFFYSNDKNHNKITRMIWIFFNTEANIKQVYIYHPLPHIIYPKTTLTVLIFGFHKYNIFIFCGFTRIYYIRHKYVGIYIFFRYSYTCLINSKAEIVYIPLKRISFYNILFVFVGR